MTLPERDEIPLTPRKPVPPCYTGTDIAIPATYGDARRVMFGRAGPCTNALVIVSLFGLRYFLGQWSWMDTAMALLVIGGFGVIEWILHAYLMHARPLPLLGWRIRSIVFYKHSDHHKDPWDPETLFFKWQTILAGVALLTLIGYVITFFDERAMITFSACVMLMLMQHEWFHVLVHSKIEPRSAYIKARLDNHRYHHYRDNRVSMGVCTLSGDWVFGTLGLSLEKKNPSR